MEIANEPGSSTLKKAPVKHVFVKQARSLIHYGAIGSTCNHFCDGRHSLIIELIFDCCPCSFSYEGDWVNGQMHGFGSYHFADAATYEGVMRDNRPNGEGTARYTNGGVYVGRWKDGKYEVINATSKSNQVKSQKKASFLSVAKHDVRAHLQTRALKCFFSLLRCEMRLLFV